MIHYVFEQVGNVIDLEFTFDGHFTTGEDGQVDPAFYDTASDIAIVLSGDTFLPAIATGIAPDPEAADALLAQHGLTRDDYAQPEGDIHYLATTPQLEAVNLAPGRSGYWVGFHEVGHALGLKHPHEEGINDRPTYAELGIAEFDDTAFTVLSLNSPGTNEYGHAATLMPGDISALQRIYGANRDFNRGDDVYALTDDGALRTIWDAYGTDTLTAEGLAFGAVIDLRQWGYSIHGAASATAIASGTDIENARGSAFSDSILGNAKSNVLEGGAGDDTLEGATGDDVLRGGTGGDVYIFLDGDDEDTIEESGAAGDPSVRDTIFLGDIAAVTALDFARSDTDLLITLSHRNSVLVADHFGAPQATVEDLVLADGSSFALRTGTAGTSDADILIGTEAGDGIIGYSGDDLILGGVGNDVLGGRAGADRYVFRTGDGTDRIGEWGDESHAVEDTVFLKDVDSIEDVGLGRVGNDLRIEYGTDTVVVVGHFDAAHPANAVERLELGDGTSFVLASGPVRGDAAGILIGTESADELDGGAGDDIVRGQGGADTLTGGLGRDSLFGGGGADTYVFRDGDSFDYVDEIGGAADPAAPDTIFLSDQASVDNLSFSRFSDDLNIVHQGSQVGRVRVIDHFADPARRVEQLELADGSIILLQAGTVGSNSRDLLLGTEADEGIIGYAGDDIIEGSWGNDLLAGRTGADRYLFGPDDGEDRIGESGGDVRHDVLDTIVSTYYSSTEDIAFGRVGTDLRIDFGEGSVTVVGQFDPDHPEYMVEQFELDDGRSFLFATGPLGSDAADILVGTTISDTLIGGAGADVIEGQSGADALFGGLGNDDVRGGDGDDTIDGEDGDDTILGGGGNDSMHGSLGQDSLLGGDDGDALDGGQGDDLLRGNDGADTLDGGDGDDTLLGDDGDDLGSGGLGSDVLYGGSGADTLLGHDGDDQIEGGDQSDSLVGGGGNDLLYATRLPFEFLGSTISGQGIILSSYIFYFDYSTFFVSGDSTLVGGAGNDTLYGSEKNDLLLGDSGDDVIFGSTSENDHSGFDSAYGGEGNDFIEVISDFSGGDESGDAFVYLEGGDGDDTLVSGLGDDLLTGGVGDDSLEANVGGDTLFGDEGADTLSGDGGDDSLLGGTGDDSLSGGAANDTLLGGTGDDSLGGGTGADSLLGGGGDDVLYAYDLPDSGSVSVSGSGDGASEIDSSLVITTPDNVPPTPFDFGTDTLSGGDGNDTLRGGYKADLLIGGAGDDDVSGGSGGDTVSGDAGDDFLASGDGEDALTGGEDSDTLDGGAGDDTLEGGTGSDLLLGRAGADRYVFHTGDGTDRIGEADGDADGSIVDTVVLPDVLSIDAVTVSRSGDYLRIGHGTGDAVWVVGHFDPDHPEHAVEQLELGDGSVFVLATGGVGGDADGIVIGTSGDDSLVGGGGGDVLVGSAGNDTLSAGDAGFARIEGGTGEDLLQLGGPFDLDLAGRAGTDITGIEAIDLRAAGSNRLSLGANDVLALSDSTDTLIVHGTAEDVLFAGPGWSRRAIDPTVTLSGETYSVFVLSGATLMVGEALDTPDLPPESRQIGTAAAEQLAGDAAGSQLLGLAGSDTLRGGERADLLEGGAGNDLLLGRAGADRYLFRSGDGTDRIGESGGDADHSIADRIVLPDTRSMSGLTLSRSGDYLRIGHDTDDAIWVVGQYDGAHPEHAVEQLQLGDGTVYALATGSNGGGSDDIILGGGTGETLSGNAGDDAIAGGGGDDVLRGGAGDDTLIGDAGTDTAIGGKGADTYVYRAGDGVDRVGEAGGDTDHAIADRIVLQDIVSIGDVDAGRSGDYLRLALPGGDTVWVIGQFRVDEPELYVEQLELGDGSVYALQSGSDGSAEADVLLGGTGADTLTGNGGGDLLVGAAGDDVLHVADGDFGGVRGGAGEDMLVVDGSGLTLDFSGLHALRIGDIEAIDFDGGGANHLVLDSDAIMTMTDADDRLVVHGGTDDSLDAGGGWTESGSESIDGASYSVYSQGGAVLVVAETVDQSGIGIG